LSRIFSLAWKSLHNSQNSAKPVESIAEFFEDSDPSNLSGHSGGGVSHDLWKSKGHYNSSVVDEGNLVWSAILAISHFYQFAAPRSGVFKFS
jgi:hypothetical protein